MIHHISKIIYFFKKRIVRADVDRGVIELINPKHGTFDQTKTFTFDAVFGESSSQKLIHQTCAAPVVQSVLEGYNGTIFCYGQTGAGKTHTMEGKVDDSGQRGIMANSFQQIFDHVTLRNDSNETYLVRVSYFEVYNEEIRDLLSNNPKGGLELKESPECGVYVKNLTSKIVKSFDDCNRLLQEGKKNRSTASTLMNHGSSRSHSIFAIVVECCVRDQSGEERFRIGKLNLVDLAGSERQSKTGATGHRLVEATKINLSLSALGNVISALVDGKTRHIPYRDSKLTRILQDSLGGNTKTLMCANCGPADYNYDETLSTLRYANRAKNIRNQPVINEDPKDTMLREYQDEIARLKQQLKDINATNNSADHVAIKKEVPFLENREAIMKAMDLLDSRGKEKMNPSCEIKELEKKLQEETRLRTQMESHRKLLESKLREMEAQLMVGGHLVTLADRRQAELRKAEQDLVMKREQELLLARSLKEKEEENLHLNEKYSSLQDEAQSKTEKLRKLWKKYQQMKHEIFDIQSEFQEERTTLHETLRELNKELKLKEMIIQSFIPSEYVSMLEDNEKGGCACWNEETNSWDIPHIDYACNNIMKENPKRSPPRIRRENIRQLGLDIPQPICSPDISHGVPSHVLQVVDMNEDDWDDDDKNLPGDPYYWFSKNTNKDSNERKHKKRQGKGSEE